MQPTSSEMIDPTTGMQPNAPRATAKAVSRGGTPQLSVVLLFDSWSIEAQCQ
jgi:hypothetical protein